MRNLQHVIDNVARAYAAVDLKEPKILTAVSPAESYELFKPISAIRKPPDTVLPIWKTLSPTCGERIRGTQNSVPSMAKRIGQNSSRAWRYSTLMATRFYGSCNALEIDQSEMFTFTAHYDFFIITERPMFIKHEDNGRYHCSGGPTLQWEDGFALYYWHGTNVPHEWFETPGYLTPQVALTWGNIEERRCACEILGWSKILRELNARTIDADEDPQVGTLVEVILPGGMGRERFVKVLCGTKREFAIPVPPHILTALEAQAWMWNVNPIIFQKPEVRS